MTTPSAWSLFHQSNQRLLLNLLLDPPGGLCRSSPNLCGSVQVSYRSTQRQVNITVRKEERGWWERLTAQERKPVFLSPDFDRWLDESDAEMEIREKVELFFFKSSFG